MSTPNPSPQKNFFDSRTIFAVVLVGVLFFGWQKYLENKYPDFYKKSATQKTATTATADGKGVLTAATTSVTPEGEKAAAVTAANSTPENTIQMRTPEATFEVSSKGMGLRHFTLTQYKDREGQPIQIGVSETHGLYEVSQAGSVEPLNFQLNKVSDTVIKGTATAGTAQVEQTLTYNPSLHAFETTVAVTNATGFSGLSVLLPERKYHAPDGTFFLPSVEHQEITARHSDGKIERIDAGKKKEDLNKNLDLVQMTAVGSQYFASIFLNKSDLTPEMTAFAPIEGEVSAKATYKFPNGNNEFHLNWLYYAGPKSIDQLQAIDPVMAEVVDLGFFAPIGKVLLVVMKAFHGVIGNWGLSIILLTLLVRLIVMPFNITSYKSMKRMQAIQPKLQSIRERYKEDPTALNRETMAVMREEKVNPIGSCLPMLLQMPVFFALYRVLGQSIELYQAPFVGWIHDLSLKDPFYVLPVLMGITMFAQQKMTPTTMDPAQAKILQFMPLVFAFFTLSLPSGLTLYIFTSTLFAVLQQQLFMRDRSATVNAVPATAK
jgi:YidC/Oxa1 family membrane protein insertase